MKCRACSNHIIPFFSLGMMPLVNSFLGKKQLAGEKKYDLSLCFCPSCYLVQLKKTVPPEQLFRNYIYFSSTSSKFLAHCRTTANYLTGRLHLHSSSLVLEIASNDGAQLQYFKQLGIPVLGIDPAKNIAKIANAKGIKTIPEFFNFKFARLLSREKNIQADLVFGANVLAHVPEIVDFVQGIKLVLKPAGTAVFEFPYLAGLFENKFDTIYHEHVFYYSLLALRNLFLRANLTIYDVEITEMQGGSLRIYVCHPQVFPISKHVKTMLQKEKKERWTDIRTYRLINTRIEKLKTTIMRTLNELKKSGKTIAAYSAPAKGNVLLNYFGIGCDYLDFIVDKSKAKQGLYAPGTHLLVYAPSKIFEKNPDYLLILCWNLADEVMDEYQKYHKSGGRFIIPIPKFIIV